MTLMSEFGSYARKLRADALGRAVIDGADLGLERLETAFDIGERFVACEHVSRAQGLGVGLQQLARLSSRLESADIRQAKRERSIGR